MCYKILKKIKGGERMATKTAKKTKKTAKKTTSKAKSKKCK